MGIKGGNRRRPLGYHASACREVKAPVKIALPKEPGRQIGSPVRWRRMRMLETDDVSSGLPLPWQESALRPYMSRTIAPKPYTMMTPKLPNRHIPDGAQTEKNGPMTQKKVNRPLFGYQKKNVVRCKDPSMDSTV
jgi:hypothetical protein